MVQEEVKASALEKLGPLQPWPDRGPACGSLHTLFHSLPLQPFCMHGAESKSLLAFFSHGKMLHTE